MPAKQNGEQFFRVMTVIVLAIVILGFGLLRLAQWDVMPAPTLWVYLHALTALGWCGFAVLQTRFIAAGNIKLHMQLGIFGLMLAAAAFVIGTFITLDAGARHIAEGETASAARDVAGQMVDFLSFGIAVVLAFANRKLPLAHKRLMLASVIFMVPPAAFRLTVVFGLPAPLTLAVLIALASAMLIYDWRRLGKPHWASWMVLGFFIVGTPIKILLPFSQSWESFLVSVLS
ncbi:MAG: hypothetical protein ABJ239_09625 [Erythrobacter sp.]